jgi:hypothetical protein
MLGVNSVRGRLQRNGISCSEYREGLPSETYRTFYPLSAGSLSNIGDSSTSAPGRSRHWLHGTVLSRQRWITTATSNEDASSWEHVCDPGVYWTLGYSSDSPGSCLGKQQRTALYPGRCQAVPGCEPHTSTGYGQGCASSNGSQLHLRDAQTSGGPIFRPLQLSRRARVCCHYLRLIYGLRRRRIWALSAWIYLYSNPLH